MHQHHPKLKQTNKKHKQGAKGVTNRKQRFKGADDKPARTGIKQRDKNLLKEGRQHKAKQLMKEKRSAKWLQARVGTSGGPPKVVTFIKLSDLADTTSILSEVLKEASSVIKNTTQDQGMETEGFSAVTANFAQFRQRFFFLEGFKDAGSSIEAAKVADLAVLVLPMQNGIESAVDKAGELIISLLKSQGMPSIIGVIQGLDILNPKQSAEAKKVATRFFQTEFGDLFKSADAHNPTQIFRALTTISRRQIFWREIRSYVVAEKSEYIPDSENASTGTLKLTGYIRGKPVDVNQLVHVPGSGSFQLRQIDLVPEVSTLKGVAHNSMVTDEQSSFKLVEADAIEQESLEFEAVPDTLAGEQTWPTEEELEFAEADSAKKREEKKAFAKKKGLDDITAAWVEYLGDDLAEDDEEAGMEAEEEENDDDTHIEAEDMAVTKEELERVRLQAKEQMEHKFPDEVDTPLDQPARRRFARYRALKSFRTSFWDPMENLPRDYSRIFRFSDFGLAQKRILEEEQEVEKVQNKAILAEKATSTCASRSRASSLTVDSMEVGESDTASQHSGAFTSTSFGMSSCISIEGFKNRVGMGAYTCLHLQNVPSNSPCVQMQHEQQAPTVLFSLLKMENKLSVLHFLIQKHATCDQPIPSKEELIFKTGFQSFCGRAIFSQNSANSDKHKYERFLPDGVFTVASVYGPITFQPCPVTVYRKREDGELQLVATGTLHSVDPNRIIVKRIILTGYPVKVKKRTATVKYMFFDPEDVRWFKPAELVTKHGLTGHIKEPLGTHGLFKTIFNKPIKQHDTVCLNLYKRVFPKFERQTNKVFVF